MTRLGKELGKGHNSFIQKLIIRSTFNFLFLQIPFNGKRFKDLPSIQKQRHILTSHLEHSENAEQSERVCV